MTPPTALPTAAEAPPRVRVEARPSANLSAPSLRDHPVPAFRAAVETLRPTMPQLAVSLGLTTRALTAYHLGTRGVPRRVLGGMVAYLRARAARLEELARELEAISETPEDSR